MKYVIPTSILFAAVVLLPAQALAEAKESRGEKRMAKVMERLDTDQDGVISRDEFQMPEDRESPEMRLDVNGDGAISRDEVDSTLDERADKALRRFEEADADGNGVVTADERRSLAFNRLDTDGDSAISKAEMRDARKQMGKRMRRGDGRRGGEGRGQ